MATFACPSCGRPTRLELASPRSFRCVACGHAGATPPDLAARLEEAAAWLAHVDLRHRQVGIEQRRQLDKLKLFARAYVVLAVPPTLLLLAFSYWNLESSLSEKHFRWWTLALFQPPLFGFVALVAVMWRRMRKRAREVEDARAAVVGATGDTLECRVCGAELPRGPGPYVCCAYCKCDNLVAADVVRRAGRDTAVSLDQFEARLKRAASSAAASSVASIASFVVGSVGVPLAWLGVFVVLTLVGALVVGDERAPDLELAIVPYGKERCVAQIRETNDGVVSVDAGPLPDGKRYQRKARRPELELVTERALAGKVATMYACPTDKRGKTRQVTIRRVDSWMSDPRVVVTGADGEETWYAGKGCGLCVPR